MKINIQRTSQMPIYLQIFEQIKRQIHSGELPAGFRLPPERKLAESLEVNRTTVLNAYRELKSAGLVGSQVGNGTLVLAIHETEIPERSSSHSEPAWNQLFSQYTNQFDTFMVKDLLTLASRTDVISFATGMASPTSGPLEIFKDIENEFIIQQNFKPLLHSPTEGFTSLRETISQLMHKRGVFSQMEEVMLVSGSQQGIDLIARTFIDPGDIVVVEEPTFFPALHAFRAMGARVIGIPMEADGLSIDALRQLLARYRPKFIYTMPSFHNPTGIEMSFERRKELMALALEHRVLLVEDDAYGELSYDHPSLPLLKSMDTDGYVLYLSTFSKNVYAGLRLGFMVAHRKLIRKFAASKQIMDLHSNSLSQWMIERFIRSGAFETHLYSLCQDYSKRRDLMHQALLKYAPNGLSWHIPAGGYYFWCQLPDGLSAQALLLEAGRHQVVFVPGSPFFTTGQGDGWIRLNFTFAAHADIPIGIERLCIAMKTLLKEQPYSETYLEMDIHPIV